ncbi:LysM peptidoglycan-binding domain-containing protein [Peribacillus sp. NPDC097225]|uniref:cell division suppressor protein YneA n=1 Tax=Peribacillus sp. NPDC097225 TaxID=3364400 RepID=UPI0038031AFD
MKTFCKNNIYTILLAGFVFILSILFSFTLDSNQNRDFLSIEINEGDTIWEISEEYGQTELTKKEFIGWIEEYNGVRADTIKAGQIIVIPVESEKVVQSLASKQ